MSKKINLAVIFGGQSKEHEVSLSSAKGVMNALDKEKYNIIPVAITKNGSWLVGEKGAEYMRLNEVNAGKENAISLKRSKELVTSDDVAENLTKYKDKEEKRVDLVLPILHGPFGEDGKLQGMLEMMGVPYVFSGVLAHALGMNKSKTKLMAKELDVPVPKEIKLSKNDKFNLEEITEKLSLPLVVKPNELGSSVGISIVKNKDDLQNGIEKAFKHGEEIILEQYIKGREFTVTVMGNNNPKALPVIEVIPLISEFYDYKAKYEDGGSRHICPAEISEELTQQVKKYALNVFEAIGCKDLARVDFILDEKNKQFYFIDINTIPGMTPTSLAPEAAKKAGISFKKLLDKLIVGAIERN